MTFHPVTMAKESIIDIMESVINFIFDLNTYSILITYPNNDDGYEEILKVIYKYEKYNSVKIVKSLGSERYYEAIQNCLFIIGNSSSGIIEAPYFNKTVINIGSRQSGRDKDNLIKDIEVDSDKVINELKKGFSINWRTGKGSINIW